MANEEHLKILQQGIEAWNRWRVHKKYSREDTPDLSRVNLDGADLSEADLSNVDLSEADLSKTILYEANLQGAKLCRANLGVGQLEKANLEYANLCEANLSDGSNLLDVNLAHAILKRANLYRANLGGANLQQADLQEADLRRANLGGAKLIGTNLRGAKLHETIFHQTILADTNLKDTDGLDTCKHGGPSTLDPATLIRSGILPIVFMRGCGWPETLINYIPSILGEPFQFYSCFISYASRDHAFAERLHADLQDNGVRCWFAPKDMKIGDRLRPRIDETIRVYDKLLLVLSKTSVASQWVEQEVETALARERQQGTTVLFPVRIDNMVMTLESGWPALIRNTRNIGDFRRWKTHDVYKKVFNQLLRDLKTAEEQT